MRSAIRSGCSTSIKTGGFGAGRTLKTISTRSLLFNCENLKDFAEVTKDMSSDQIYGENGVCVKYDAAYAHGFSATEYLPINANYQTENTFAADDDEVNWACPCNDDSIACPVRDCERLCGLVSDDDR